MSAWEEAVGKSDHWYTPKYIFDALTCRFDLDVAAPKEGPRYVPADDWFWQHSLESVWFGFVWMNPPFGGRKDKQVWLNAFFDHGDGIALTPDRTSAPWWQAAALEADAILFIAGKPRFERPDGSIGKQPGNGVTLLAAGQRGVDALRVGFSNGLGFLTEKRSSK